MFLKNSFSFAFLAIWLVLSSLHPFEISKTRNIELEIPTLNYQERMKQKNNSYIYIEEDLDLLKTNDKFTIKIGNKTVYYKVITKYVSETLPTLEEQQLALIEKNSSTLQTIIIAVNTGELVKI